MKPNLKMLESLTLWVNQRITYKTDSPSHWQPASETRRLGTGDCEDYAILKLQELYDAGCDITGMTIGVVRTRKKDSTLHAVLLVPSQYQKGIFRKRTADCVYVLDNLSNSVYRWEQTGYEMVRHEPASKWVEKRPKLDRVTA